MQMLKKSGTLMVTAAVTVTFDNTSTLRNVEWYSRFFFYSVIEKLCREVQLIIISEQVFHQVRDDHILLERTK